MMKFKVESMEDFARGMILVKLLSEAVDNGENTEDMLNCVMSAIIEYSVKTGMDDKTFIKMAEDVFDK